MNRQKALSKSERKVLAIAHYRKWQESGLSKSEYCRQNNLKITTFIGWKKYLDSGKNKKLTKIPSRTIKELASERSGIELRINGSLSIALEQNFNADLLRDVLQTLGVLNEN